MFEYDISETGFIRDHQWFRTGLWHEPNCVSMARRHKALHINCGDLVANTKNYLPQIDQGNNKQTSNGCNGNLYCLCVCVCIAQAINYTRLTTKWEYHAYHLKHALHRVRNERKMVGAASAMSLHEILLEALSYWYLILSALHAWERVRRIGWK